MNFHHAGLNVPLNAVDVSHNESDMQGVALRFVSHEAPGASRCKMDYLHLLGKTSHVHFHLPKPLSRCWDTFKRFSFSFFFSFFVLQYRE